MSSDAQRNAGYILPDPVDGYDLICVTLKIPNVRQYRAALLGAIYELSKWWNWEKSNLPGDTRATRAAAYWRQLLYDHLKIDGACPVDDLRISVTGSSWQIEKTTDGGATWTPIDRVVNEYPEGHDLGWRFTAQDVVGDDTYFAFAIDRPYNNDYYRFNLFRPEWFTGGNPVDNILDRSADPRTHDYEPPYPNGTGVPAGETAPCLSAETVAAWFEYTLEDTALKISAGGSVFAVAALVGGFFATLFSAGLALPFVVAGVSALIGFGGSNLVNALAAFDWSEFKCILFCNAESDGSYSVAGYNAILNSVGSQTGMAWDAIEIWLQLHGRGGLTSAANSKAATTGDCDGCGDCTWCHEFDFTASAHSFVALTNQYGTYGTYGSGIGWQAVHFGPPDFTDQEQIYITRNFSNVGVTKIEVEGTCGTVLGQPTTAITLIPSGQQIGLVQGPHTYEFTDDLVLSSFSIVWTNTGGSSPSDVITKLRLYGVGSNPFGLDNC